MRGDFVEAGSAALAEVVQAMRMASRARAGMEK
jgi:hypothetical protein